MESIRLENVRKTYARGRVAVPVLKGISLSVKRGEMVAVMGASGSGKTTLINILGALDQPTAGRYWLDGEEVSQLSDKDRAWLRNEKIGFVFQNYNLLPRLTALENVMMPLIYSSRNLSGAASADHRAEALLKRVGLENRLLHESAQLSGGEQQRVAIARAARQRRARCLIADEPTGNVDSTTGEDILKVFQTLNAEDGITVILVTHDPSVAEHAGRTIHIRDGLIVEEPVDTPDAHDELLEAVPVRCPTAATSPPPIPGGEIKARSPGRGISRDHGALPRRSPQRFANSVGTRRPRRQGSSAPARDFQQSWTRTYCRPARRSVEFRGRSGMLASRARNSSGDLVLLSVRRKTALRALRRNVMRSVLTTLGIIIGVAALIAIAEIGNGSASAIKQVLVSTGANNLLVQAGAASSNGVSLGSGSIKTLTPEDADAIANECSAVDSLAPIVYARRQVVNGNKNWVPIYIYGTTPGFLRVRGGKHLRRGTDSPNRTSTTSRWFACSAGRSSTSSSTENRRSARKSTSTTCRSRSLAS